MSDDWRVRRPLSPSTATKVCALGITAIIAFAACGTPATGTQPLVRDTLPPIDNQAARILDDPAMDHVADIVEGDVDPNDGSVYATTKTHFINDLDSNIAGFEFMAQPKGVDILTPDVTYLVATGMIRDIDGNEISAGVYVRDSISGTIDVVAEETVPLPQCGRLIPRLIRDEIPTRAAVKLRCGPDIRLQVDLTTTPPTVQPLG